MRERLRFKVGDRYGRLTVIDADNTGKIRCLCDCGTYKRVSRSNLKTLTRSCGCILREITAARNRTHGKTRSAEYRAWRAIKDRCYLETCDAYPWYGGRGIKVCDRWLQSFENFYADMGDRPSSKHSIDREDSDRDYSPENCRWATAKEQSLNKKGLVLHVIEGFLLPLGMIAEGTGVPFMVLKSRIDRKYTLEEALGLPKGLKRTPLADSMWSDQSLLRHYNKASREEILENLLHLQNKLNQVKKVMK